MSIEGEMNHSHSELSERKNEKLAQLYLFFHPQDSGELQSTKVFSDFCGQHAGRRGSQIGNCS